MKWLRLFLPTFLFFSFFFFFEIFSFALSTSFPPHPTPSPLRYFLFVVPKPFTTLRHLFKFHPPFFFRCLFVQRNSSKFSLYFFWEAMLKGLSLYHNKGRVARRGVYVVTTRLRVRCSTARSTTRLSGSRWANKKSVLYSGVHPRVSTLIQPSFQKK